MQTVQGTSSAKIVTSHAMFLANVSRHFVSLEIEPMLEAVGRSALCVLGDICVVDRIWGAASDADSGSQGDAGCVDRGVLRSRVGDPRRDSSGRGTLANQRSDRNGRRSLRRDQFREERRKCTQRRRSRTRPGARRPPGDGDPQRARTQEAGRRARRQRAVDLDRGARAARAAVLRPPVPAIAQAQPDAARRQGEPNGGNHDQGGTPRCAPHRRSFRSRTDPVGTARARPDVLRPLRAGSRGQHADGGSRRRARDRS